MTSGASSRRCPCGSALAGSRRRCDPCRDEARRERQRKYDRRVYEAARSGTPRIGDIIQCAECGGDFTRTASNSAYCSECARAAVLRNNRVARAATRHATGAVAIGSTIVCTGCSASFVAEKSGRRKYCDACRASHASTRASVARRRKTDPAFALNGAIKSAIYKKIRQGRSGEPWTALLGYSLEDLKRHLERQFAVGMSWDNYGEWHVDHIRALCRFTFTSTADPEFRSAWALSNLRPLWRDENHVKQARLTLLC